jgi:hypothetical protein
MTPDTSALGRKSSGATPLKKLARMLQSMSRRWPKAYLVGTTGGFGVRLGDGTYLHIVTSGDWTSEDMRDFLALFATWLVADPEGLRRADTPLDGRSYRDRARQ